MALSVRGMRTAVIIPVLLSLFLRSETLGLVKGLGIVIAILAFWMLREKHKLHNLIWIALLFVITGATDLSLKIFSEYGGMDNNLFLFFLFSAAYVFTLLWIMFEHRSLDLASLGLGLLLGIPNQLSSLFFLNAGPLPASLLFRHCFRDRDPE